MPAPGYAQAATCSSAGALRVIDDSALGMISNTESSRVISRTRVVNLLTFINLKCVCLAPLNAHHDTLAMVVVGRDGSQTRLATWVAVPGHTATPAGSISTPLDQIAAVQVVSADSGQVLLQRSL